MFTGAAGAEIVNDSRCFAELAGGVGPHIRTVGFLRAWREHLHRCFIGVDDRLPEHDIAQRVDHRLQLHAGHAYPLSQSGTWNRQARSTESTPGGTAEDDRQTWRS
jgi:hypothetical protein